MRIRVVTAADLPVLREIERAAGACFHDVGMAAIADDEPMTEAELAAFPYAWVAEADDRPVAYLVAEPVDRALHVEQVSVHPGWAHRRIGRCLLDRAADVATAEGRFALTLTTFAHVPWNAPYYERCGFAELPDHDLTPGLRAVRDREAAHGLDRWPRVTMARMLRASRGGEPRREAASDRPAGNVSERSSNEPRKNFEKPS